MSADTLRRGLGDVAGLAAFLDGVMGAQMKEKDIAGATVAVVKDGQLLLARGYGYADVAERKPVDPARTLFRIGSITKVFTWTAVMQQVEEGRIDLDADVNTYLDFSIPATYPEPITMRHILVHAPGFEEDSRDLFSTDSADIVPMGEWLAAHIPARVRPPGQFSSYSNYASALAGYIVERVSGMPYDDYVDRRILEPLGMSQTTTRQPLPPTLGSEMSRGYRRTNGRFEAEDFEIVLGAAPAGSMSSSATDMARFMIAHLNEGELDGRRILGAETAREMHRRAFAHDERVNGFALGFYEKSSHGVRIIGHGGDTRWFHSDLALIPSEGLGVFVSYNSERGGELSFGPFLTAFLDHFYPTPAGPVAMPADARERAAQIAGTYQFNRRSHTTFQKAMGLAQPIRVSAGDDGTLVLHSPFGAQRFAPIEPLLYREELGQERLAFRADDAGHVTHAFISAAPMMALERVAWYASPTLHWLVLGLGLIVFLGTLVAAARRWFRSWRRGSPAAEHSLPGWWLIAGVALVNLVFVVALALLARDFWGLLSGPATGLRLALTLPVIGALLTGGALVAAVLHWRRRQGTLGARLRYSAVVLVSLLFIWSLNSWNLLGWRM